MVIARIFGGLGNQLFCYAAARRLAYRNNTELKIDLLSGFKYDLQYKREYLLHQFNINAKSASKWDSYMNYGGRIRRKVDVFLNSNKIFEDRTYIVEESKYVFNNKLLDIKKDHNIYLEGYWHSEKYFKDIDYLIRKDLTIKESIEPRTKEEATLITSKQDPVCLGYRFYQETKSSVHKVLENNYYKEALQILNSHIKNPHFFIFCNDIELAKQSFTINYPHTYITSKPENRRAVQDLYLMQRCRHFIIPNSSFHWWGAWLSENKNKLVIAPSKGFSNRDMLPERWVVI